MHHDWATRVAEEVTDPLLTCEAVLAETAFHLNNVGIVLEMIGDELVRLSFDCNDHLPQLADLAKRYADRQPDLDRAFHLNNVGIVLEMIGDELVRLSFDCNDHLPQLADLAKRYADRQPELADLCL